MNRTGRRSPSRGKVSPCAYLASAWCAVVSCALLTSVRAEDAPQTLSVPVLGSSQAEPADAGSRMEMTPAASEETQPTLPGGKLPQYQLTSRMLPGVATEQIEESKLRFLLALPAEPILIEADITIDGEAFRKQREQRVRSTLQAALKPPEKRKPAFVPLRAEKPAVAVNEDGAPQETKTEGNTPSVSAYRSAGSNVEKLRRYIASIGREPSLEEVRWFFIDRLDGPTLLLLKDHFQAFRSDQTPIFHILDRNRDNVISKTEIDQAVESFRDCDLNRNDIVDYLEINEAADDPRLRSGNLADASALLYLLPGPENAVEIYADLLSRYDTQQKPATSLPSRFDANSNGQWEAEELEALRTMPADITLTVSFDSTDSGKSSLSVTEESLKRPAEQQLKAEIVNSSIVVYRPDCELWLSASQYQAGDQISLGAVSDGYPMLPVLDPNDDGRFTIRELRDVTKAIRQFDANGDGQIHKEELHPTIRVSFGLGASVHQSLAGVRSVHSPGSPPTAGPGWFVRMDRNQDNDLTRQEFPGTDDQFTLLDADGDKLISAEEALESDRQNSPTQPDPNTSDPSKSEKDTTTSKETTNSES